MTEFSEEAFFLYTQRLDPVPASGGAPAKAAAMSVHGCALQQLIHVCQVRN